MLKIGKLYTCEKYHLLFYPDADTASAAEQSSQPYDAAPDSGSANPSTYAAYWSNRFGKTVSYADKNIPLLVLNSKDKCVEVLAGDLKGWIIYRDWLKIREIE
jgi:hypothetical protein